MKARIAGMKKGFTLIELLIVVVILGIVSILAIPTFSKIITRSQFREVVNVVELVRTGAKYYDLKYGLAALTPDDGAWPYLKIDKPTSTCELVYTIVADGSSHPTMRVSRDGSAVYEYDLVDDAGDKKAAHSDSRYLPPDDQLYVP